jgi:hypothetical protein
VPEPPVPLGETLPNGRECPRVDSNHRPAAWEAADQNALPTPGAIHTSTGPMSACTDAVPRARLLGRPCRREGFNRRPPGPQPFGWGAGRIGFGFLARFPLLSAPLTSSQLGPMSQRPNTERELNAVAGFLSGIHVRLLPADRPSCSAASACPVDSAVVTLRPSQATRCPGLPVGPGGARSRTAVVVGFGPCGRRTGPWREWRACLTPRCCHYGLTWHHLGATLTPWIWRRMSRTSAASSR